MTDTTTSVYDKYTADTVFEQPSHKTLDRFNAYIDKTPNEKGCWVWVGSITYYGYARFHITRLNCVMASRYQYFLCYGNFTTALRVCHKCDNPRCVNPEHLFLGTDKDNMQDKKAKGRALNGENIKQHKLTDDQIDEIRGLWLTGEYTQSQIGSKFGVDQSHISLVVRGLSRASKTLDNSNYYTWVCPPQISR